MYILVFKKHYNHGLLEGYVLNKHSDEYEALVLESTAAFLLNFALSHMLQRSPSKWLPRNNSSAVKNIQINFS